MKQSFLLFGRCRIKFIPLVLIVVILAVLLRLGFWQLSRAEEKRTLLAKQAESVQGDWRTLDQILAEPGEPYYKKVMLEGHYDNQHQFLMENQFLNGKLGYFVLTPFILKSESKVVLINRGWLPIERNKQLPDVDFDLPEGVSSIVGIINDFPGVGMILKGADEPGAGWPSVVQVINRQKILNKLKVPIFNFQVQLSPEQENGYVREWKINASIPPEKHIAYAVQWFALAITLIVLALWGSCKKEKND